MSSRPPLAPGLYERLITSALKAELDTLEREGTSVVHSAPIDPAGAHATLARHIEGVVARALRGLPEKERKAKDNIANLDAVALPPTALHAVRLLTGNPGAVGAGDAGRDPTSAGRATPIFKRPVARPEYAREAVAANRKQ